MTQASDTSSTLSPVERLSRLRAVLFDLDGTLIDTGALILASFRYATTEVLGAALPDEVVMAGVGTPLKVQFADFAPDHADELLRVYRAHNSEHHDQLAAEFPGVGTALRHLSDRGLRMGVVTSKSGPMADRGLRLFGLRDYFELVVSADDVDVYKPDPYPLLYAAERLGVPIEECAYVGDSPHDMQAAVASGGLSIAALWGIFTPEEVLAPGPEFALDDITELPLLLDGEAERYLTSNRPGGLE